jgi:hypothetical protein
MPTVKKASAVVPSKSPSSKLVPAAPESSGASAAKKRKRLAKAFSRPLDKKFKDSGRVRVKVSVLNDEHEQLLGLQQRLARQGIVVKKSELLRAGLLLLDALDDGEFQLALAKVPAIG